MSVLIPQPPSPQGAASGSAILVQGLVREFKGVRAVDGIDLHVETGEIYGFLGPNGAGKSTTVKMLITLLPPSGGQALVGGYDVGRQGAEVRRVIGAALQDAALDPKLTAWEHMRLQAGLHGFSRAEAEQRGAVLLERVALTGAANRAVGGYSGGMKRRLDLALTLVHSPRIVFLDEPTTGLDPQSRAALWDEVSRLARDEGVTVFLTTQYLEEADVLADRVGIIDHGKIVAEGSPAELKAEIGRPTLEAVPASANDQPRVASILQRFGQPTAASPNAAAVRLDRQVGGLPDVVRALDADRIVLANLELRSPTLDDVFLEKTGRSLEGAAEEVPEREPEEEYRGMFDIGATGIFVKEALTRQLPILSPAKPDERAEPVIVVRGGPMQGERFVVGDSIVIGREADVVLSDPEISRRHALLRRVHGMLIIEDLGSLNGTWMNGRRITTPTLLTPGDVFTVGQTAVEYTTA